MVTSSALPMLKTSPRAAGVSISLMRAPTTSRTWPKHRLWVPSPKTVIGSPANPCSMNRGITIPYRPVCRGPTVLNSRAITTGSFDSFQWAIARNSSSALAQA